MGGGVRSPNPQTRKPSGACAGDRLEAVPERERERAAQSAVEIREREEERDTHRPRMVVEAVDGETVRVHVQGYEVHVCTYRDTNMYVSEGSLICRNL